MARQTPRRSTWRRTKTGSWTCSLGERGCRVRLFEKRSGGGFYREVHLPKLGRDQKSLGTRDRDEAERLGKALLAQLLMGHSSEAREPSGPVRLGRLWERYSTECPTFADNKASSRADASYRVPILLGFLGSQYDLRSISTAEVAKYVAARRHGGIHTVPDSRVRRSGSDQRTQIWCCCARCFAGLVPLGFQTVSPGSIGIRSKAYGSTAKGIQFARSRRGSVSRVSLRTEATSQ